LFESIDLPRASIADRVADQVLAGRTSADRQSTYSPSPVASSASVNHPTKGATPPRLRSSTRQFRPTDGACATRRHMEQRSSSRLSNVRFVSSAMQPSSRREMSTLRLLIPSEAISCSAHTSMCPTHATVVAFVIHELAYGAAEAAMNARHIRRDIVSYTPDLRVARVGPAQSMHPIDPTWL